MSSITLAVPVLKIGIQQAGGRLHDVSLNLLAGWGFSGAGSNSALATVDDGRDRALLVCCRIADIARNVADDQFDLGIISSDVFWKSCADPARPPDLGARGVTLDFGSAASWFRLGICRSLVAPDGSADLSVITRRCLNEGLPIVTSNKAMLMKYFSDNALSFRRDRIYERDGTVEAQGRALGAPLIADLTLTGTTMRAFDYMPQTVPVSESRLYLIGRRPKRPPLRAAFDRLLARVNTDTAPA